MKKLIIAVVLTVAAVGCTAQAAEHDSTVDSGTDYEITAADVVDVMPASQIREFCDSYYLIGDYELALAAFEQGYDVQDPSAEEMMDELVSRC